MKVGLGVINLFQEAYVRSKEPHQFQNVKTLAELIKHRKSQLFIDFGVAKS